MMHEHHMSWKELAKNKLLTSKKTNTIWQYKVQVVARKQWKDSNAVGKLEDRMT